ncbi:TetR/AcrR family transcriptional regulator [Amycolatopsis sp. OK19-0408]|uniref:TetR/AcrR family transcriptional regulator n=1 Tax=Amycolatopsis iheyensis TaxID=2945988 RepID=A0A9X2NN97_9PSEU|nr:TetR/AcrR family transcriptional regulator [Amycolatopsis iheyensis]MCR6489814.1 TetR/AcrR family transcriptional regulator [Amycolatopsis iheyensis]
MSPRPRDPVLRANALSAAARLLAEEGPSALSTRRLARELGVSTAAVYTYFGSIEQLRREVRLDGFARLESQLDSLGPSADPVTDLSWIVREFFEFGVRWPHLYRAMFVDRPPEEDTAGKPTFTRLIDLVRCGVDGNRFAAVAADQAELCAAQVWSMPHGMVTMVLSGALTADAARAVLRDMVVRLAVGYGDDRRRAARSLHFVSTSGTK